MSEDNRPTLTEEDIKFGAKLFKNADGTYEKYFPVKVGIRKVEWYPESYLRYMNGKNA